MFYEKRVKGRVQRYKSFEEFAVQSHINYNLLKNVWHEVENADYGAGA